MILDSNRSSILYCFVLCHCRSKHEFLLF